MLHRPVSQPMHKILVVDDDAALRGVIGFALQTEGYEVLEAEDGAVAIQVAREQLPDLILCDIRMKEMDGYLALANLRRHVATASLPFILMTGQADSEGMRKGMELGADDYLAKPFTIPQLVAAVEARLKKQQTVREQAERKLADLRANISLALPHELLTPLNGILGFAELLIADPAESPAEVSSMAECIRDSALRLHRVIENFTVFVQLELRQGVVVETRTGLELGPTVERVAGERARRFGRQDDLILDLRGGLASILEDYFAKIVGELMDNAFKFSESGTPVRVELFSRSGQVVLRISDAGRGMKTEHVSQVGAYMQFERRLYEQQGSGLGLTIAKRLTELHGGSLTLASTVGEGTVVEVRLPVRAVASAA
jgi:two-component system, sensor histidine kinase and response regulator